MAAEEQKLGQRKRNTIDVMFKGPPRAERAQFTWPQAFAIAAIWGAVFGTAFFTNGFYGASTAVFAYLATRWIV